MTCLHLPISGWAIAVLLQSAVKVLTAALRDNSREFWLYKEAGVLKRKAARLNGSQAWRV